MIRKILVNKCDARNATQLSNRSKVVILLYVVAKQFLLMVVQSSNVCGQLDRIGENVDR